MTLSILAIDDSLTIRTLLTRSLEQVGFDVTTAVDGVDGVEKFNESTVDLVITDINMPNMDGFGVIETIRGGEKNKTVPILVLTTESSQTLKDRAKKGGATGWIVKPFTDESLIRVIKKVKGV